MTFVTIFLVTKVPGTETEAQHTQNKNTTSSKKDSVTKTSLELKCEECGKVFKHQTFLKRHLVELESTENYSCKRCDAKFKRKDPQ